MSSRTETLASRLTARFAQELRALPALPGDVAFTIAYHRRDHRDGLGLLDRARPPSAYTPVTRTYPDPQTGAPVPIVAWPAHVTVFKYG
mgnify:CR=1 FL=1